MAASGEGIYMITGELKSKINRVWDTMWSGGISNPLSVIEQLTYLLSIKRLDELHTLKEVCVLLTPPYNFFHAVAQGHQLYFFIGGAPCQNLIMPKSEKRDRSFGPLTLIAGRRAAWAKLNIAVAIISNRTSSAIGSTASLTGLIHFRLWLKYPLGRVSLKSSMLQVCNWSPNMESRLILTITSQLRALKRSCWCCGGSHDCDNQRSLTDRQSGGQLQNPRKG